MIDDYVICISLCLLTWTDFGQTEKNLYNSQNLSNPFRRKRREGGGDICNRIKSDNPFVFRVSENCEANLCGIEDIAYARAFQIREKIPRKRKCLPALPLSRLPPESPLIGITYNAARIICDHL